MIVFSFCSVAASNNKYFLKVGKTSGVCGRIERNNIIKDKIYKFSNCF